MSRRAAIYLRAPAGVEPRRAVDDWLRSEGYLRWESLPKGYPASPEEVRELVYEGAVAPPAAGDGAGWAVVTPEAFQFVFRFALEMARRSPDILALGVTDRWDGRVVAKLFRGDRVLLKVGEDRDDELPYIVPVSEGDAYGEAGRALGLARAASDELARWGQRVTGGEAPSLGGLARAFGLPGPPGRFAERRAAAAAPGPAEYVLFVHRRSPLYLNA